MAVVLTSSSGERYELVVREGIDEQVAVRDLLDRAEFPGYAGWAKVLKSGAEAYVNLAFVERIEFSDGRPHFEIV